MKKKDLTIIKKIQAEAWGKYGDKLFIEEEKAGNMRQVIDHALNSGKEHGITLTDAERDKLKNIKDSGMLEGTHKVEDPKIAKKFEKYVEKRIAEEIKAGNLTKPDTAKKKANQLTNRQKRELKYNQK